MSRKLFDPRFAQRLYATQSSHKQRCLRIPNSALTAIVISPTRTIHSDDLTNQKSYISPLDIKPRPSLVDAADLEQVAAIYDEDDRQREVLIKSSRDILKYAKKAIYDLHRKQIEEAKCKIHEADTIIEELSSIRKVFSIAEGGIASLGD